MNFEFYISSAAIATICSLISGIVSAVISARTVEKTASKEIERMKLAWAREDVVSSDDEFSDMVKAVTSCTYYRDGQYRLEAMKAIAVIRAKENGSLAVTVDELYASVRDRQYETAEALMSQVITEKRRIKNHESAC